MVPFFLFALATPVKRVFDAYHLACVRGKGTARGSQRSAIDAPRQQDSPKSAHFVSVTNATVETVSPLLLSGNPIIFWADGFAAPSSFASVEDLLMSQLWQQPIYFVPEPLNEAASSSHVKVVGDKGAFVGELGYVSATIGGKGSGVVVIVASLGASSLIPSAPLGGGGAAAALLAVSEELRSSAVFRDCTFLLGLVDSGVCGDAGLRYFLNKEVGGKQKNRPAVVFGIFIESLTGPRIIGSFAQKPKKSSLFAPFREAVLAAFERADVPIEVEISSRRSPFSDLFIPSFTLSSGGGMARLTERDSAARVDAVSWALVEAMAQTVFGARRLGEFVERSSLDASVWLAGLAGPLLSSARGRGLMRAAGQWLAGGNKTQPRWWKDRSCPATGAGAVARLELPDRTARTLDVTLMGVAVGWCCLVWLAMVAWECLRRRAESGNVRAKNA